MAEGFHTVIYKAIADFRELYREAEKAKAELRSLDAEQARINARSAATRAASPARAAETASVNATTQAVTKHTQATTADTKAAQALADAEQKAADARAEHTKLAAHASEVEKGLAEVRAKAAVAEEALSAATARREAAQVGVEAAKRKLTAARGAQTKAAKANADAEGLAAEGSPGKDPAVTLAKLQQANANQTAAFKEHQAAEKERAAAGKLVLEATKNQEKTRVLYDRIQTVVDNARDNLDAAKTRVEQAESHAASLRQSQPASPVDADAAERRYKDNRDEAERLGRRFRHSREQLTTAEQAHATAPTAESEVTLAAARTSHGSNTEAYRAAVAARDAAKEALAAAKEADRAASANALAAAHSADAVEGHATERAHEPDPPAAAGPDTRVQDADARAAQARAAKEEGIAAAHVAREERVSGAKVASAESQAATQASLDEGRVSTASQVNAETVAKAENARVTHDLINENKLLTQAQLDSIKVDTAKKKSTDDLAKSAELSRAATARAVAAEEAAAAAATRAEAAEENRRAATARADQAELRLKQAQEREAAAKAPAMSARGGTRADAEMIRAIEQAEKEDRRRAKAGEFRSFGRGTRALRNLMPRRQRDTEDYEDDVEDFQDTLTPRRGLSRFIPRARRPRAKVTGDEPPRGSVGERLTDLGDSLPRLGENFSRWQKILIAVTAGVIALIPVIAVVAAAFGALLSAAVGAASALGIFAVAAVGHFAALKKNLDEAAKTGSPIKKEYEGVANALNILKAVYQQFLRDTSAPVMAVFTEALILAAKVLPRFTPLVKSAGQAIQAALGQLSNATNTDTFTRFLEFVGTKGVNAIGQFARVLLTVGQGLAELAMAFGPFISTFIGGLQRMATSFERWAASLSSSDKFQEFMQYAIDIAPKVGAALAALIQLAMHLGVALAPIGAGLLLVVRILAAFVTAIPTDVLTTLVGLFIALWVTIRVLLGVAAVASAFMRFQEVLTSLAPALAALAAKFPQLAAAMGIAETGAVGLRTALIGLGAATAITAVIFGVMAAVTALSTANDEAAASTRRHAEAVDDLSKKLRENKGELSQDDINELAGKLSEKQTTTAQTSSVLPYIKTDEKIAFSVSDEAKKAGIALPDLTKGITDEEQFKKNKAKFDKHLEELKKSRDDYEKKRNLGLVTKDTGFEDDIAKQIAAAEAGSKAYGEMSVSQAETNQKNRDFFALGGKTAQVLQDEAKAAEIAGDRFAELAKQTDHEKGVTDAVAAYDAYTQSVKDLAQAKKDQTQAELDAARAQEDAKQRVKDASIAVRDAMDNERTAQENLTQARLDAAAKLEEYRRKLRDLPLDEEQARLNLEKAEQSERKSRSSSGTSSLDRRQAVLDVKRARNALNDQLVDQVGERNTANAGLAKGIEGQPEVIAALKAVRDASIAVQKAQVEYNRAQEDLPIVMAKARDSVQAAKDKVAELTTKTSELATAMDVAGAKVGMTRDQLKDLKLKQDAVNRDLQFSLSMLDPSDVAGRLNEIALRMEALKLIANDPTLSPEAAYRQAAINAAKYAQKINIGGRGNSRGSQFAEGGAVEGAGTGTSDSIDAKLSRGEHVWTAAEVIAVGGHTMVKMLRQAALNKKLAAAGQDPSAEAQVAHLFRQAGIAGRRPPARPTFDPASFAGALNTTTRAALAVVPTPTATTAASTTFDHSVHKQQQFSTGDITINNPVREPAGGSLYRTVRKLRRDYD